MKSGVAARRCRGGENKGGTFLFVLICVRATPGSLVIFASSRAARYYWLYIISIFFGEREIFNSIIYASFVIIALGTRRVAISILSCIDLL